MKYSVHVVFEVEANSMFEAQQEANSFIKKFHWARAETYKNQIIRVYVPGLSGQEIIEQPDLLSKYLIYKRQL